MNGLTRNELSFSINIEFNFSVKKLKYFADFHWN